MSVELLYWVNGGEPQVYTDDTTDDPYIAQQNLIMEQVTANTAVPFTLEISETADHAATPRKWYHTHTVQ